MFEFFAFIGDFLAYVNYEFCDVENKIQKTKLLNKKIFLKHKHHPFTRLCGESGKKICKKMQN